MSRDERSNQELLEQVEIHLQENEFVYDPSSLGWQENRSGVNKQHVRDMLCFHLNASATRIGPVMTVIEHRYRKMAEETGRVFVEGNEALHRQLGQDSDVNLRRWLTLMQRTDTTAQMHEAHVLLLKQWLWQIKRHIMNLPVVHHILLTFWSREGGSGKSYNIKRLIRPLEHFSRTMSVNDLNKDFIVPLLQQARILLFDEFAGASRTEAGKFKRILTDDKLEERGIHSDAGYKIQKRFSCIATSNLSPPHGFHDETGGRRFWPIHCSGARTALNLARLEALDELCIPSVWAAVSYEEDSPYSRAPRDMIEFINAEQERCMRAANSLLQFTQEALLPCEQETIAFTPFRQEYARYCRINGLSMLGGGREVFANHLKDIEVVVAHPKNRYQISGYTWRPDYEQPA